MYQPVHPAIFKIDHLPSGRNPDWVARPFFAEYGDRALWLKDLKPAFGAERFFFEEELEKLYHGRIGDRTASDFE